MVKYGIEDVLEGQENFTSTLEDIREHLESINYLLREVCLPEISKVGAIETMLGSFFYLMRLINIPD